MVSSPELHSPLWSLPVERPDSSVASSRPEPHGPSQGNILCLVERWAITTTVPACGPDYIGAQVLATSEVSPRRLRASFYTHVVRSRQLLKGSPWRQSQGALAPLLPLYPARKHHQHHGLPLRPTKRTQIPKKLAHSQTGTHLRASLQAFGLFFIVFDTTLFTLTRGCTRSSPRAGGYASPVLHTGPWSPSPC